MDSRANTADMMDLQAKLRFFYESAMECNMQCVSTYSSKNLDNQEAACVEACANKQMQWTAKYDWCVNNHKSNENK